MLRHFFAGLLLAFASLPVSASAQSGPIVVELFTSQGCSSCPPADKYLATLVDRDDVLPLAFHVDYWDRLGWKDTFATPEFTRRQYAYGQAFQNRSVWTPQFVIGGTDYSRGSYRDIVPQSVKQKKDAAAQIDLRAQTQGGEIVVSAQPLVAGLPEVTISLVGYTPEEVVAVKRGENAGHKLSYHNIVRLWMDLGDLSGQEAQRFSAPVAPDLELAVIAQEAGHGAILAAARVK